MVWEVVLQQQLQQQNRQQQQQQLENVKGIVERLWDEYTGSVPDAALYSLTIAVLLAALHAGGVPTLLLPRVFPSAFAAAKLQPSARNSLSALAHAYAVLLLIYGFLITPLILSSYPFFQLLGVRMRLPLPSLAEIIAHNTVYFLVEDYLGYWLHRWYHTEWAYKTFHHVHHEFTAPESFASIYAHPLEVLCGFLPSFAGLVLVPPHLLTFWIWIAVIHLHAFEIHCGYDLRWSPTRLIPFYGGAAYHDYHHRNGAKCFSNFAHGFALFDTIYGTNKGYLHRKRAAAEEEEKKKKKKQS